MVTQQINITLGVLIPVLVRPCQCLAQSITLLLKGQTLYLQSINSPIPPPCSASATFLNLTSLHLMEAPGTWNWLISVNTSLPWMEPFHMPFLLFATLSLLLSLWQMSLQVSGLWHPQEALHLSVKSQPSLLLYLHKPLSPGGCSWWMNFSTGLLDLWGQES